MKTKEININLSDLKYSMICAVSEKYRVSLEIATEAMELTFGKELYTDSLLHALEIFLHISPEVVEAAKAKVELSKVKK